MKLGQLAHDKRAQLAAAGGVVVLAIIARRGASSSSTTPAQSGQLNPSQGGYYDSTANDVYQSMQPEIDALASQVGALTPGASTPAAPGPKTPPKPAPAPKPKPKAKPKKKPAPKPKPVSHALTYTVRRGDTLGQLAQRLHVRGGTNALYNANRAVIGSNKNLIRPGEKLRYSR